MIKTLILSPINCVSCGRSKKYKPYPIMDATNAETGEVLWASYRCVCGHRVPVMTTNLNKKGVNNG